MGRMLRTLVIAGSLESMKEMLSNLETADYDLDPARVMDPTELQLALRSSAWDFVLASMDELNLETQGSLDLLASLAANTPVLFVLNEAPESDPLLSDRKHHADWVLREDLAPSSPAVKTALQRAADHSANSSDHSDEVDCAEWRLDLSGVGEWIRFQGLESGSALREYFTAYPKDEREPESFARVVSVNAAAVRWIGCSSEDELLGSFTANWPPAFRDAWSAILEGLVEGIRIVQTECQLVAEPGWETACVLTTHLPERTADLANVRVSVKERLDARPQRISPRRDPESGVLSLTEQEEPPVKVLTPVPRPDAAVPSSGASVLLVDDQDAVRSITKTVLSRHGYRVIEASNAEEALAVSRDFVEPIDVLLTDLSMPGMCGEELATNICAARPRTKVVFMSGYTGQESGNEVFLQKPFLQATLLQTIRDLLGVSEEA
jgi:CheY-like chemotaxis protein